MTCETFEGEKETFSDPASCCTTHCHARHQNQQTCGENVDDEEEEYFFSSGIQLQGRRMNRVCIVHLMLTRITFMYI